MTVGMSIVAATLLDARQAPVAPGTYDLRFRLHATAQSAASLWEERLRRVVVGPAGGFRVVLGMTNPLTGAMFAQAPRWLSVEDPGDGGLHVAPRIPLLGDELRLADELDRRIREATAADPAGELARLRARVRALEDRVAALEERTSVHPLLSQITWLGRRIDALEGPEGPMARFADELEDLIGPDGDIPDLTERIDALERRAVAPQGESTG